MSPPRCVDVLIAGAGPAGAAAAIALRQRGRTVHLVERAAAPRLVQRPAFSETLWPAALSLLERLGLRDEFMAGNPPPCHGHWSAWGSDALQERSTLTDPNGPGWFLQRPAFDAMLRRQALRSGAEGSSPARVVVLGREPNAASAGDGRSPAWDLRIEAVSAGSEPELEPPVGERRLRARFLLDAGGRTAPMARVLGASRHTTDRLAAVSLSLPGQALQGAATHVETCAWGWWYVAPGTAGRVNLTLMTDADLVRRAGVHDAAALLALFATSRTAAQFVLQPPAADAVVRVCPAATGRTLAPVGEGWAAVGDAAWSLDPLSSRGLTAALLGGLHVAQAIDAALSGRAESLVCYSNALDQAWAGHLQTQQAFYAMEQRFADAPFWQRRRVARQALALESSQKQGQDPLQGLLQGLPQGQFQELVAA